MGPKYIHVNSLDFLSDMKQLRFFRFLTARLKSKDYTPVLSLENVEHLTLRPCKEVKNLYSELIKLPKIKYGLLISKPELYLKWYKSQKVKKENMNIIAKDFNIPHNYRLKTVYPTVLCVIRGCDIWRE